MLKRTLKYGLLILTFCTVTLLYLIYLDDNRISLILNLGTNVPSDIRQVSMQGDRKLRFIHRYWADEDFSAKCKTTKISLMNWLKTSNFEVIYCGTDSSGKTKFYHDFNSLPKDILDNKIGFGVQLSRDIADSPQLSVTPVDSDNVFLEYVFDWN